MSKGGFLHILICVDLACHGFKLLGYERILIRTGAKFIFPTQMQGAFFGISQKQGSQGGLKRRVSKIPEDALAPQIVIYGFSIVF